MEPINVNDSQLNSLFKELVDGCRDDLKEAQDNIDIYFNELEKDEDAKQLWGTLYNDALKIKGAARARQLQLLVAFKDRVNTKEKVKAESDKQKNTDELAPYSQEFMNNLFNDAGFMTKLLEENAEISINKKEIRKEKSIPIEIKETEENVENDDIEEWEFDDNLDTGGEE